jgi:hypothetical protein
LAQESPTAEVTRNTGNVACVLVLRHVNTRHWPHTNVQRTYPYYYEDVIFHRVCFSLRSRSHPIFSFGTPCRIKRSFSDQPVKGEPYDDFGRTLPKQRSGKSSRKEVRLCSVT